MEATLRMRSDIQTIRDVETFKQKKWGPTSRTGIFVGYELKPGYTFNGTYRVYDLSDFAKMPLHVSSPASGFSASLPTGSDY